MERSRRQTLVKKLIGRHWFFLLLIIVILAIVAGIVNVRFFGF